jgi:uncharacterized protein YjhX (UPF0386 family)
MFQPATRKKSRLRMTLDGPAGSGKTYTALRFAHTLANGGRIAYIDTERGSASKYVGECPDGTPWTFDVVEMTTFSPEKYTELIQMAGKMGYTVLVIDSLSHAWEGVGGALEIKDRVSDKNQYTAWRTVTPIHNRMVDTILQSPCHVITTMRSRMEYVQDLNEFGKVVGIRKVGMAPIQRPGMEYEFDLVCDMDWSHILTVSKSRCSAVADMKVERPGPAFITPVIEWLSSGTEASTPVFAPAIETKKVAPAPEVTMATLDGLVAQYGVDRIVSANNGVIPGTQDELELIAGLLALEEVK